MENWKFHAVGVTGKVFFLNGWCMVFVLAKLMVNPAGLWRTWSEWKKWMSYDWTKLSIERSKQALLLVDPLFTNSLTFSKSCTAWHDVSILRFPIRNIFSKVNTWRDKPKMYYDTWNKLQWLQVRHKKRKESYSQCDNHQNENQNFTSSSSQTL